MPLPCSRLESVKNSTFVYGVALLMLISLFTPTCQVNVSTFSASGISTSQELTIQLPHSSVLFFCTSTWICAAWS